MKIEFALVALCLATSLLATRFALIQLTKHKILAVVDKRSSHTHATPTSGGLGLFAGIIVGIIAAVALSALPLDIGLAVLPAGILVACVGFLDDSKGLSQKTRLLSYSLASIWLMFILDPITQVPIPGGHIGLGYATYPLTFLCVLWILNLFNFMDGINGLVSGFALIFGVVLAALGANNGMLALLLAAACLGFLPWNFPKAKVFLGDCGSVFIGLVIAAMLLSQSGEQGMLAATLILIIPMSVDATLTLAKRTLQKKRIYQSHKEHLYQMLTNELGWGHVRTTLVYNLFTLVLLVPMAYVCSRAQVSVGWLVFSSYALASATWLLTYMYIQKRQG